jgi:hypothetical protein
MLQNAGCNHLHHSHCLLKNPSTHGCPSGCPSNKFPREAVTFDVTVPHITLVWDGDRIDKVPVPVPVNGWEKGKMISMTSEEVVGVVRAFLEMKGFVKLGLSLRIHSRDPGTEYVLQHYCIRG